MVYMEVLMSIQVAGVICNLASVSYVMKKKLYRGTAHMTHFNLCSADLIYVSVGLFNSIMDYNQVVESLNITVQQYLDQYYTSHLKSQAVLRIEVYLYVFFQNAVLLGLFPLIFDRIIAIKQPLLYGTKKHTVHVVASILTSWFASCIYGFVMTIIIDPTKFIYHFASRTIYSISWVIIFCVCPLVFNCISFYFIISKLSKLSSQRANTILFVNTIKAVLTTFFFTLSWLPLAFSVIIFNDYITRNYSYSIIQYICLYMSTVTDPIMYLLPITTVRRMIRLMRARVSISSTFSIRNRATSDIATKNGLSPSSVR